MNNLYNTLAPVYEAMYQTFIDYEAEYQLYSTLLKKYGKTEVLEIICGTGNLVPYFKKNGFNYIGLDLSAAMRRLAKEKVVDIVVFQGDMRNYRLKRPIGETIIFSNSAIAAYN